MALNCLQLNKGKTGVILLDPYASTESTAALLGPLVPNLHTHVRNLGVTTLL